MTTVERPQKCVIIGTSPIRPDGVDKVTGKAPFGDDVRLTGTLYGQVLRSHHGLFQPVGDASEIHFLPALAGG